METIPIPPVAGHYDSLIGLSQIIFQKFYQVKALPYGVGDSLSLCDTVVACMFNT